MRLKKILKRKGYAKIDLKTINTNHFELKAKINGVDGRFILDTGASNSCIDFNEADLFQLTVEESETKAAGAGAIGLETKISTGNDLSIGTWAFFNATIVLLDLSHVNTALVEHDSEPVNGIIGADILEKGKAVIDYNKKCLFLKKLIYKH